jgi:predicted dehydrogenase
MRKELYSSLLDSNLSGGVKMRHSRREFVKITGAASFAVLGAPALLKSRNANDKIRMGFIGVGNRGTKLLRAFRKNSDVQVAALCDVYKPYLTRKKNEVHPKLAETLGSRIPPLDETFENKVELYTDFRKLLEDKSIDAVCIATPDHWHAVQTTMACQAGKDIYVEKPLTITINEGRKMVNTAKDTNRIVAVGLNRRGSVVYQHLAKEVQAGKIGRVSVALAGRVSNMFPVGIGKMQPSEPPKDFDWDMWLGPRAERPYQYNIAPYKFRWWSDYSSQMGNWGVHYMDVLRWMMGETAPISISAVGSRNIIDDDSDIPDTMEVLFEFKSGSVIKFSLNEACSGGVVPWGEVALRGTKGNLYAQEKGYKIDASSPGQFQSWEPKVESQGQSAGEIIGEPDAKPDSAGRLIRNFLDCVKTREQPWCSLEEGHRSTSFAHLANISLARGKRLEWDAEKERFTNDEKANELLQYEYRKPWKLV